MTKTWRYRERFLQGRRGDSGPAELSLQLGVRVLWLHFRSGGWPTSWLVAQKVGPLQPTCRFDDFHNRYAAGEVIGYVVSSGYPAPVGLVGELLHLADAVCHKRLVASGISSYPAQGGLRIGPQNGLAAVEAVMLQNS